MAQRLIELIQEFIEKTDSVQQTPNGEPLISYFNEKFAETEPVSRLEKGWIDLGDGGGRTGAGYTWWTVSRLHEAGRSPEEIAAKLTEEIERNSFEYLEVWAVEGVKVHKQIELEDGFHLVPNTELPRGIYSQVMFGRYGLPFAIPSEKAALVHKCVVSPAIVEEHNSDRDMTEIAARMDTVRLFKLALGLATNGYVALDMKTQLVSQDSIFFDGGGSLSGRPSGFVGMQEKLLVAPDETLRLKALIKGMENADALELAIDRLIKSRGNSNSEDKIIDLGMAAEIALMHQPQGSGDGKGEITNKISSRAAWLLGRNTEERVSVFDEVRDLYSARSITVHTGKTPDRFQQRSKDWDTLVARIMIALLERGSFPDWKRLVLSE